MAGAVDRHGEGGEPSRQLKFAIFMTGSILVVEVVGGLVTGSLALLADASHVFMDVFALSITLGAIKLARLPSTETRTFGWHRAEVIAALINGLLLIGISVEIFHKAYGRLLEPQPIRTGLMLCVALVGLVVNLIVGLKLRSLHSHDLNMRSAYLHVMGDLLASVAVIVGGVIILFTKLYVVDSILSMVIGLIVLVGAVRILLAAGHILLEGVPRGIRLAEVVSAIRDVPKVKNVHDVHIWSVCSHILSLSCHVAVGDLAHGEYDGVLRDIRHLLRSRFCIVHSTIEVGFGDSSEDVVSQDLDHEESAAGEDHHHH